MLSWQSKNGCYGKVKKLAHSVQLDKEFIGQFNEEYEDSEKDADNMKLKFNEKADVTVDEVRELRKRYKAEVEKLKFRNVVEDKKVIKDKVADNVGTEWEIPANTGRRLLVEKSMSGKLLLGLSLSCFVLFACHLKHHVDFIVPE